MYSSVLKCYYSIFSDPERVMYQLLGREVTNDA